MSHRYAAIAFTPRVKDVQTELGSRRAYAPLENIAEDVNHHLGDTEAQFILERDSFYMATVGETGWPYVQHRGGPPGFVRVLDEQRIGFADFRGNRQYITVGNLATNDRVSLFFMDYASKTRLKILGRARVLAPSEASLLGELEVPEYRARVERGLLITIEAFDWNCSQHITERFTEAQVREHTETLESRIRELELELARYQNKANVT